MGYIKEPKGIDFVIQSEPLTEKDRKDISEFIADYKAKHKKKSVVQSQVKSKRNPHRTRKISS